MSKIKVGCPATLKPATFWEHGNIVNTDKEGNKICGFCGGTLPKNWRDKDPKLTINVSPK